jgi:hypothetical protein
MSLLLGKTLDPERGARALDEDQRRSQATKTGAGHTAEIAYHAFRRVSQPWSI